MQGNHGELSVLHGGHFLQEGHQSPNRGLNQRHTQNKHTQTHLAFSFGVILNVHASGDIADVARETDAG